MICKNCSAQLPDNVMFCTECGAKLEQQEEAANDNSASAENQTAPVTDSEDVHTDSDNASEAVFTQTPPAQEIQPDPQTPKKVGAGRFLGASIIAVFAFIFLMLFNLVLSSRIGFSSDIVKSSAESMSMETLLDSTLESGETVAEYIYNNLDSSFIRKSKAEVKDIRGILINSNAKEFLAETLEGYAAYIVDGSQSGDPSLTAKDVVGFLEENKNVFSTELYYNMSQGDYDLIRQGLLNDNFDEKLSVSEWSDEIGFNVHNLNLIFSFITIGIVLAIVVVLFIWIAIVLDKRNKHVLGYISNIMILAGLLFFIPSVVFIIGSAFAALNAGTAAAYICAKLLLPLAAVAACTGAFEVVAAVILKKIRKHIRNVEMKKAAAAA
ncbi:MAG: zinc ribbon domain-containing protein [Ruminococcus sp.]|nr:zinc ribbon domain-containing protein [Ruminococcus sp.]